MMKYKLLKFAMSLVLSMTSVLLYGQDLNVQQNQQNVNINFPVIEKKVYIERYHPVYIDKPRQARKLSEPEILLGYLCVFPEDIGNYMSHPTDIIASINQRMLYGRNTWRIPTHDELMLMVANADRLGLSDEIYMATSHANGNLRLVSTEASKTKDDGFQIGSLMWQEKNFGAKNPFEFGVMVEHAEVNDLISIQSLGWRLPRAVEIKQLLMNSEVVLVNKDDNGRFILCFVNANDPDNRFCFPLEAEFYPRSKGVSASSIYRVEDQPPIKIKYYFTIAASEEKINNWLNKGGELWFKFDYEQLEIEKLNDYRNKGFVRCVKSI